MKNKKTYDIIIGSVLGLIISYIIIFSIENNKSFLHVFLGFILFIIPFTFFSSFFSRTGSFIFMIFTSLTVYFVDKFLLNDFWIGVLISFLVGGSLYYFKVLKFKPFSQSNYPKINDNE